MASGAPDEAEVVEDVNVVGGKLRRDVAWVKDDDGSTRKVRWDRLRPLQQ